jgi:hypothetical protein
MCCIQVKSHLPKASCISDAVLGRMGVVITKIRPSYFRAMSVRYIAWHTEDA